MQAIEFLQGLGWITVAAYCLNNLGLVPPAWTEAIQSQANHVQTNSPTPSPNATPSPSSTSSDSGNEQQQFTTQP